MSSFSSFAERLAYYESIDKFYWEKLDEAIENARCNEDNFDFDTEDDLNDDEDEDEESII